MFSCARVEGVVDTHTHTYTHTHIYIYIHKSLWKY